MTEIVKKMTFALDEFTFVNGKKIKDVKIGYETWGTLNAEGTNAIYICAFHSGTAHAAGKYRETDAKAGYWDAIIGPGKPLDTNKYFIVSADNFCNLRAYDPDVITTGPASINPETGKHYGMDFPVVTQRDLSNLQYQLLRSLKVNKLQAVIGASLGGVNAYDWPVAHPDFVERVIGLGAAPIIPAWTTEYESVWCQPIRLDPRWNNGNYYGKEMPIDGFALTMRMLSIAAYSPDWAENKYGRKWGDPQKEPTLELTNMFLIEKDISELGYVRCGMSDPNHMIYLNKAAQSADISRGFPTYEDAIKTIKAKVLFVATDNDQLFALHHVRKHYEKFVENGVKAEFYVLESPTGHMAVILDIAKAIPVLEKFLNS